MEQRVLSAGAIGSAVLAILAGATEAQPSPHAQHHPTEARGSMLTTLESIAAERSELHETLESASKKAGPLGAAARELEAALSPHFRREEEIATPPLGLLPALVTGEVASEMRAVLPMTEALERELPQMVKEHHSIRAEVSKFLKAAEAAGNADYIRFSDSLAAHARQEGEILYPAAILVGRFVARATASK